MIEILILSLVQGITEFLPISSSSHLIIIAENYNFKNQSLILDVSLHMGSFFAVLVYFRNEILDFVKNKELFLKILISSIPVMIAGYLLVETNLIEKLRNIKVIGWTTVIFGILLFISDKFKLDKNIENNFNLKSALFIGLFQILSLVPGVSRAGIAITAGRFLSFNRFDASKISFLLSIPTLGAVSIYGLSNIISSESFEISRLSLFAILFSFIFSFLTINYFLKYIKKFSMNIFVIYRLFIGLILLYFAYL